MPNRAKEYRHLVNRPRDMPKVRIAWDPDNSALDQFVTEGELSRLRSNGSVTFDPFIGLYVRVKHGKRKG